MAKLANKNPRTEPELVIFSVVSRSVVHGREPKKTQKIPHDEKRMPSITEQDQLEITNSEQKSAYISYSKEIALKKYCLSTSINREILS
jgi:hypothetical protein